MPTWIFVLAARVVGWLRDRPLDEEFTTEFQSHLEMLTEDNVRRGMTPADAERAARVRLGNLTQLREDQREGRGLPFLDTLLQDVRYALRMFRRSPGFTVVAILTVALGIGVNTIVFTLVDAVAFKPLPVADAGNLVRIKRSFQSGARGDVEYAFSFEEYSTFRAHSQRLSSVIAVAWPETVVATGAEGELLEGRVVSDDYFTALGVSAPLGRTFLPEENRIPGANPVIVLSDGSWRRHFHADPQVVGRTVMLNGTAFTIVGVAPAQFIGTGNPPQAPDFWAPLMMQGQLSPGAAWLDRPDTHRLQLLARVQADASIEQARAELQGLALQIAEFPETHKVDDRTIALTLQPAVYFGGTDDFRFAAVVALLMATVSIILIVACANLANMLLARGAARHKEIGMRLALGASRGRIVRQLLTESLLLAGMGGVTGLLLSFWGSTVVWRLIDRLIRILFLSDRPFAASVALDGRILVFTVAVSIATGLLFGLSPALRISRPDLNGALKEETAGFGNRRRATRSWLNALQMAVSMTFLICAGLLLKGLAHAQSANLGFESSKVLMAFMNLGTDPVAAPALQKRIVDRLRKASEIEDVALTDRFPFAGTWSPPIMVDDPAEMPSRRATRTLANYVSASYFHTLGISIQRGRTFTSADEEGGSAVAIVSEAAARRLWPSGDPIGKRLTLDMDFRGHLATFEVIGVVKDVRSANVSRIDPAFVYLPTSPGASYNILIRSNHDPARVFAAVTRAVESTDRRVLPTVRVMSVNEGPFVRMQTAIPAIVAPFVATLGCVALILAGTGIYGVTSYLAVQRTHEVGIRMALGATARDVQRLMVRQAMTPILAGGVVGLGAAATISRLLQSTLAEPSSPDFLFGVGAFDMTAFAGLSAFAMIVAAVASYIPARRATAVDPLVALRHE